MLGSLEAAFGGDRAGCELLHDVRRERPNGLTAALLRATRRRCKGRRYCAVGFSVLTARRGRGDGAGNMPGMAYNMQNMPNRRCDW